MAFILLTMKASVSTSRSDKRKEQAHHMYTSHTQIKPLVDAHAYMQVKAPPCPAVAILMTNPTDGKLPFCSPLNFGPANPPP